jgi:signal transduction histidine kinase/predicted RNA-binding protein with RPS1 domain
VCDVAVGEEGEMMGNASRQGGRAMTCLGLKPTPVQVEVVETRNNGLLVKLLKRGVMGFIRRREISWDRRVGVIPTMPQPGEKLDAIILEDSEEGGFLYLSLSRVTDPWEEVIAEQRYRVGQSVEGEVVNVRHFGAFVQLEPGIDCIIRPKDVPKRREQGIEDVLWVGDIVRGVITRVDLGRREIDLSLWDELRRLDVASDRQQIQLNLFGDDTEKDLQKQETPTVSGSDAKIDFRFRPGIPQPQRFLVVDDEENDLLSICERLRDEYRVEVDGVKTGQEAVAKVKTDVPYGLAVIDIRLSGERGTEVAEQLRAIRPELPVLYISGAWITDKDWAAIEAGEVPLAGKDPDEIVYWVNRLCSGYWVVIHDPVSAETADGDRFAQQLGVAAFARRSLQERLGDMVVRLRKETQVARAMVLELDPPSKTVSVIAADPALSDYILETSLSSLYYSPVRNVIEDEDEFRRNDVKQDQDRRFKNLFPSLHFRSCFGIPLFIPDHVTRHALFLFGRRPGTFSVKSGRGRKRVRQCRLAAQLMAVAIERSILLEHMRRYQVQYSHGRLLSDLVHEVNNKLSGLRAQVARLQGVLPDTLGLRAISERNGWLDKAKDAAGEIDKAEAEIRQLVRAYQRLARHDLEPVDANDVVHAVNRQLEYTAREASVTIILDLEPDIPCAGAIQSQLEQVVMNLILNSIQQIDLQRKLMERIGKERGKPTYFLQHGLVIVQAHYRGAGVPCPVQIRVLDTGPGIHRQQQERVFSMGFSNRGGAGLGLYISRNLIDMVGGRLSLAASRMFIGSDFVVELPVHPTMGEER